MKNVKKLGMLIICGIVLTGFTFVGGQTKVKTSVTDKPWKIGHIRPSGTVADKDIIEFISDITKGSSGEIKIDLYPANQLGDYQLVQERVSIGDVDMQLAPAGTNVDKALGMSSIPYLVTNWEEARRVYRRGGPLLEIINEKFEKQNIKLIASYPVYFGGIALAKEPVEPENPDIPKNIKIRVPGMKAYELGAHSLGYLATPIPYSEAFTAMQTGIVDGVIGSGAEGYYSSFRDVTKYYLPLNDHFEIWYLFMNLELWNKLTPNQQEMIESAGVRFEEKRFELAEADQKKYEEKLKESGIVVYDFSDDELAKMANKAREEVWPKIKKRYGSEIFDIINYDLAN